MLIMSSPIAKISYFSNAFCYQICVCIYICHMHLAADIINS